MNRSTLSTINVKSRRLPARLFIFLIISAGLIGGQVLSARAATLTVNSASNDIIAGDGLCTLIEAINNANDDADTTGGDCPAGSGADAIELGSATHTLSTVDNTTNGPNGLPSIISDVTINGNGAVIERSAVAPIFRIFHVAVGGALILNDLTVSGGSTVSGAGHNGNGGGLLNAGGTVTVSNVVFSGNTAAFMGGGMANGHYDSSTSTVFSGILTVSNSTIEDNSARHGGGILAQNGPATITSTTIANNTAVFDSGGIFVNTLGTAGITDSTIDGNTAGTDGGGISNIGEIALTRSTVSGNIASARGGGILNVRDITIIASTVSGNTAGTNGGGIFNQANTLDFTITNTTITDNMAGSGGGIFINPFRTVIIANTILAGNIATAGNPDCDGDLTSNGHNLVGDDTGCSGVADGVNFDQVGSSASPLDALLGALSDFGGPTETHELIAGSPAIDAGSCAGSNEEQRGFPRPSDQPGVANVADGCDIGAFEVEIPDTGVLLQVSISESNDPVIAGTGPGNLTYVVTLTNSGSSDASGVEVDTVLTLPAGVTQGSVTPSAGSFTDPIWSVGDLAAGDSATLMLLLTVDSGASAEVDAISATATLINPAGDTVTESTSIVFDTDGDGVGDDTDAFPDDPEETADTDNDGVGDNADAFSDDPEETADTDGDGVGDNADAFPDDPEETADTDGDGVGDNADAFPDDPEETADSDGDGVGDNADAFPDDPEETADADNDGVGDAIDNCPLAPNPGQEDVDNDGVGNACDTLNQIKLIAGDGAAGDSFGRTVSAAGDTIVVGAAGDDDNGSESGSAYVFVRNGDTWSQQAKLIAGDGAVYDFFGYSVSAAGDTIVVGAYGDDDNGSFSGSAYVFVRTGDTWSQQAKLIAGDGDVGVYFGYSVSAAGDTIVVGAFGDDDNGSSNGSAYVFVRNGDTWSQQAKLTAGDGAAQDFFGVSVSAAGDTIVVGAYLDDDNGSNSGSAYVFVRNGDTWSQQAKLIAGDGAAGNYFGRTVSAAGDTIVVGAYGDDGNGYDSGSAYVFVRNSDTWSQQAKLIAGDGAALDFFGSSVSAADDTIVVGAYGDNGNGYYSGSAYVFVRNGDTWSQQAKLIAGDGAAQDFFGSSVSAAGDTIVVGAYNDDDNGSNSGSVYLNLSSPDADGDGIVDALDPDDDNDGIPDVDDALPFDPNESADNDADGIGDNADPDDDNDGLSDLDEVGLFGTDPFSADTDGDGTPDNAGSQLITASDGGTVATLDGETTFSIPAGSLAADTTILIVDTGASGFDLATDQGVTLGIAELVIGPAGTAFDPPATIELRWDDSDDDGIVDGTGVPEEDLYIAKDGVVITGRCNDEPGNCDTAANTFRAEITGLSQIALVAPLDGVVVVGLPGVQQPFCLFGDRKVEIKKDALVQCPVGSNGDITIQKRAAVEGPVSSLGGKVEVKEDAVVGGDLVAEKGVKLKKRSLVQGSVISGGNVEIKKGARVEGDVLAAGRVKLKSGAVVTGVIEEGATVPPNTPFDLPKFEFFAGGPDIKVAAGDTLDLDPGSYGTLAVKKGAVLHLRSGDYRFEAVKIGKAAALNLDASNGPITIDVVRKLDMNKGVQMVMAGGDASDIRFRILGRDATLKADGQYLGTYSGVRAKMELKKDSTLLGALVARKVSVNKGATVSPVFIFDFIQ